MSPAKRTRRIVKTHDAPMASAPISQGVLHNSVLYTGGQAGIVPGTGQLASGDFAGQAQQALTNLSSVASAAGTSLNQALKVTVYLARMDDYEALNAIYSTFFSSDPPARKVIQTVLLPGILVEFDAVIAVPLDA